MRALATLATLLALVTTSSPAPRSAALPIRAQSLHDLLQRSELVVWAEVRAVAGRAGGADDARHAEEPAPGGHSLRGALLEVRRGWLGDVAVGAQLEVEDHGAAGCPAPAVWEAGEMVLAFLARSDEPDGPAWRSAGYSYGAKYPGDAGLTAYAARIDEWLDIQRIPDASRRDEAWLDWLVRLAEHPATLWEALIACRPRHAGVGVSETARPLRPLRHLDAGQLARLAPILRDPDAPLELRARFAARLHDEVAAFRRAGPLADAMAALEAERAALAQGDD